MRKESIVSRAHRTLRRLNLYRDYVGKKDKDLPNYLPVVPLQPDEALIGVYENYPGQAKESILITDLGLYILTDSDWLRIQYEQIKRIEVLGADKHQAEELYVFWDESKTKLAIRGRRDRFSDLFEFLHFLVRVSPNISLS